MADEKGKDEKEPGGVISGTIAGIKALGELEGVKGLVTQLAEALGLTARARRRKTDSIIEVGLLAGLGKDDPEIKLAIASQVLGLDSATIASIRAQLERERSRLEQSTAEFLRHAAKLPAHTSLREVDEGFLDHWIKESAQIGDERVREVWARVLLQEAQDPGSISKSALSKLALFSRSDAELLIRLASRSVLVYCESGNKRAVLSSLHARVSFSDEFFDRVGATLIDDVEESLFAIDLGLLREKSSDFNIGVVVVDTSPGLWSSIISLSDGRELEAKLGSPEHREASIVVKHLELTKLGTELISVPEPKVADQLEALDGVSGIAERDGAPGPVETYRSLDGAVAPYELRIKSN